MRKGEFRESGYPVPRKDRKDVRDLAHKLRKYVADYFGWKDDAFRVVDLIEYWGSEIDSGNKIRYSFPWPFD